MTLGELVKEYLLERGESLNKFVPTLARGVSGFRELNMDVSAVPKIDSLEIDTTLDFITLPNDYVQYVRVGIVGPGGIIYPLGKNDSIALPRQRDDCGDLERDTENNTGGYWAWGWDGYADNYRDGQATGRMFGLGGGNNVNGYYRIDREQKRMYLQNVLSGTTHIVLEYIADIQTTSDGNFEIHPFIVETIKAWIFWRESYYNPRAGTGATAYAEKIYHAAWRRARARFNTASVEEWIAAFREQNMLAPRW